ncbi:hypothetical protein [Bradyrhizobium sp.]|jgi:hypothetical protein|uniref:hypothetical protein n=1 Tax=Bradyrhizobium sp. TaxID=376 RepID=UPI002CEB5420|nr:hypothetical protein [Candidatus Acidoferrum sp.]
MKKPVRPNHEPEPKKTSAVDRRSNANLKAGYSMQNLSPRHVKTEESLRLGVVSGWYSTKVSGTFVSGPHDSEAECLRRIAEIDLAPVKAAKAKPVE